MAGGTGTLAAVKARSATISSSRSLRSLLEATPLSLTGRDRVFAVIADNRTENDLKLSASHVAWASTVVPNELLWVLIDPVRRHVGTHSERVRRKEQREAPGTLRASRADSVM